MITPKKIIIPSIFIFQSILVFSQENSVFSSLQATATFGIPMQRTYTHDVSSEDAFMSSKTVVGIEGNLYVPFSLKPNQLDAIVGLGFGYLPFQFTTNFSADFINQDQPFYLDNSTYNSTYL